MTWGGPFWRPRQKEIWQAPDCPTLPQDGPEKEPQPKSFRLGLTTWPQLRPQIANLVPHIAALGPLYPKHWADTTKICPTNKPSKLARHCPTLAPKTTPKPPTAQQMSEHGPNIDNIGSTYPSTWLKTRLKKNLHKKSFFCEGSFFPPRNLHGAPHSRYDMAQQMTQHPT
jgi:hypothetical protein